jgi:hypothetical protein
MKHAKTIGAILLAGAGLLLGSKLAKADSVTIILSAPVQEGGWGATLEYDATITNVTSSTIYLNNDSYDLNPSSLVSYSTPVPGELDFDDSDGFFGPNFPTFLAPGEVYTGELFTVTVEPGTPFGLYEGNVAILGGSDGGTGTDLNPLETVPVPFDVQVTPEPPSWQLMAMAFLGLLGTVGWSSYRRRQTAL